MNFENIIGNTEVKTYLENTIKQNNILHSYLFLGTEGIGKLLVAKAFAKKALCLNDGEISCKCKSCLCFDGQNHPDFFVINEEGETIKIEQIREITDKVLEKPIASKRKVYIINDCDKMTPEAQNCILKTLEEPPEFVVIILISSNENLILNTIKSRCMSIKFNDIPIDLLEEYAKTHLEYDVVTENMLKSFGGSIGKAIKLKNNQEKYLQIENIISSMSTKDIVDIMLEAKVLYDKENVSDILDYVIVCLYSNAKQHKRYIYCIEYVNKCLERLRSNSNFDMSIDTMLFEIWEELNESSCRN